MKILCIGPLWRGSNAGGLFRAFSRAGHLIEIVDEFYYLSLMSSTRFQKLLYKIIRSIQIGAFNKVILQNADLFQPDLVLVYKGHFVLPETLVLLKKKYRIVNFYPDVSFHTHGSLLQKTLPLYEIVFTTKTFGLKDMAEQLGQKNGVFIPHGFDPEIHRPLTITPVMRDLLKADVSFIGTWSPRKETYLISLTNEIKGLKLKIWGGQWEKAGTALKKYIQGKPVTGDLYAAAIACSDINLGLLSEKVSGASSGDLITSRTFHIPASGGFLLHQYSDEVGKYLIPDMEACFFDGEAELAVKVKYYLAHPQERIKIARAGYLRVTRDHSLDERAKQLLNIIQSKRHLYKQLQTYAGYPLQ